jgi:hypothetical protein
MPAYAVFVMDNYTMQVDIPCKFVHSLHKIETPPCRHRGRSVTSKLQKSEQKKKKICH